MPGAFAGVRVLDFSQGIAGPMACMLLADLEADVVKVEPPGGDRLREHPGYLCWNRNKHCIELDLEKPEGRALALQLIAGADVAVFDAAPGELERLGLDAARLTAAHPGLLHAWFPPYGSEPRWAALPPSEILLAGLSGVAFSQFSWEDVPVHLVTPLLAYGHALLGAVALACGLYERAAHGRGQSLVVSGIHAASALRGGTAARVGEYGRREPQGARGTQPNYRLYRCADGEWLFLGALLAPQWERALGALELRELLSWEGVDGDAFRLRRPEHAPRARAVLEACFAARPRADWLRILAEHDVPRGPVGARDRWFASEAVGAIDMRVALPGGPPGAQIPGVPARLGSTPGSIRHAPRRAEPDAVLQRWSAARAPAPRSAVAEKRPPLDGVTVLDLGAILAGPFGTSVLASFGAQVIKVEPLGGDGWRSSGIAFVGYNQGKRSIAIDLRHPEGKRVFAELARRADVVCDNYRLGVLERLGLDPASVARMRPEIVQSSVTGYGTQGPLAAEPGFDPLLQARSGLMAAQGGDDEPVFHQIAVNDMASALVSAFGVVAALYARRSSGRGQRVETSLAHQSVLLQSGELSRAGGQTRSPAGGRDCPGVRALERFYRVADGWIALDLRTPAQLRALAGALGHPEWSEHDLDAPRDGALAAALQATLAGRSRDPLVAELVERGVPAAPARPYLDVLADPALLRADLFRDLDHPDHGAVRVIRGYADWSRTPSAYGRGAPRLGEHAGEILRELGFAADEIAELARCGAVLLPAPDAETADSSVP